jgi:hypothetical protein
MEPIESLKARGITLTVTEGENPKCRFCEKPATCYGSYEGLPKDFACDDCCGHGCEDGHCDLLEDLDD